METLLTPINEDIVREREDALRRARAWADSTRRAPAIGSSLPQAPARSGGSLDLLVVTLFLVLAAGFVSLVVSSLHL